MALRRWGKDLWRAALRVGAVGNGSSVGPRGIDQDTASQPAGSRQALWREIAAVAALTASETGRTAFAPRVMAALARVPREAFVAPGQRGAAYDNVPLPIGQGQTISQPFIVALMTDLLDLEGGEKVLEIGTGSGYGAAVLAELAATVFSVERLAPLAQAARERLQRLGYRNIEIQVGDGHAGWPEHAPYDAIVVTAAATSLPPALVAQLKPGGRLVIPLGDVGYSQTLTLVRKDAAGKTSRQDILAVAFVPMVADRPLGD